MYAYMCLVHTSFDMYTPVLLICWEMCFGTMHVFGTQQIQSYAKLFFL